MSADISQGHAVGYQLQQLHKDAIVPKGAVYVSQWEMIKLQKREIDRWKPRHQMWPFTYGLGVCGVMASLTGVLCFSHYKRAFNLGHKMSRLSLLTALGIPCATTIMTHHTLITEQLLSHRYQCTLCLEAKAAFLQLATGAAFPLLLTIVSSAATAKTYLTAAVPPLTSVGEWTRLIFQMTRPIKNNYMLMCLVNVVLVEFLLYNEQSVADKVLQKVRSNITASRATSSLV